MTLRPARLSNGKPVLTVIANSKPNGRRSSGNGRPVGAGKYPAGGSTGATGPTRCIAPTTRPTSLIFTPVQCPRRNPDSAVVALIPGLPPHRFMTPHQDYIAGEIDDPTLIQIKRQTGSTIDGTQIHVLSHLGDQWGMGAPRFKIEQMIEWSRKLVTIGGVITITWDVPIQADGTLGPEFMQQLTALGKALKPQP